MEKIIKKQKTLEIIRICADILMILVLLSVVFYYKTEVRQAIGIEKPNYLLEIYHDKTGEFCFCGNFADFSKCVMNFEQQKEEPKANVTFEISLEP